MKTLLIMMILSFQILSNANADIDENKFQFIKLDINSDGLISQEEQQKNPELYRFTRLYSLRDFILADIDQDGYIDMKEFVANEEITY